MLLEICWFEKDNQGNVTHIGCGVHSIGNKPEADKIVESAKRVNPTRTYFLRHHDAKRR